MTWDDTKATGSTLTANEWNAMVTDQKARIYSSTATATYEPLKGSDDNFVTDAQLVNIGNLNSAAYQPSTAFAAALGVDDNYVTDAEKIVIGNTSNTNSGDQTITLTGDVTGSGTGSFATTIATDAVDIAMLSAGGTAGSTTFLRGDNTWSTPVGSGDVSKVGTPVDNQVGVWTGDGTIEGTTGLTYTGTALGVTGNITLTGTVDGIDIATDVAANTSARHAAVTLSGTPDYITISGQAITRGLVDLASDVTGYLPVANIVTSSSASSTTYLRGDGTWATPASSTSDEANKLFVTVGTSTTTNDYTCDGTSDNVQIQAAIDEVNTTGGGTVFIRAGNYYTSAYITMKSNVALIGEGWTTVIQMNAAGSSALIGATTMSNFSISNIKFDHYTTNKTGGSTVYVASDCSNYLLSGLYVTNGYSNNIIVGGTNGSIKDCIADYTTIADGILVHSGTDITINGCISMNTQGVTANGIAVYSTANTAAKVTISNCVSHSNGSYGFQVERAKEVVVSNCVSYSNAGGFGANGIAGAVPENVIYTNCYSFDNTNVGYNLNVGKQIVLDGCISNGEGEECVRIGGSLGVTDVTINGCQLRNGANAGIRAYNTSSSTINYVITNNTIVDNSSYGIELQNAPGAIISGNRISNSNRGILTGGEKTIISNNYIKTAGGQWHDGIYLDSSTATDCIISNNYVEEAGQHGINVLANNVVISGNIVKNSNQYSGGGSGIRLAANLTGVNIANNLIFDDQGTASQQYGIVISSGCDYISVVGNNIFDNTSGSISGSVGANGLLLSSGNIKLENVVEDTTPQLGGNLDWNSNGFTLIGQTVGGSNGNLVYLSAANTWTAADADFTSTCSGMLGIRVSSTVVLTNGVYTTTGLTAGATYYASATAGGITTTAPSTTGQIVRIVGYAVSTTELFFDPDKTYIEVA